jgi:hypothetical protein
MAVKHFKVAPGKRLLIILPDTHIRILIQLDGRIDPLVSNDKCSHRGGPLHLCYTDSRGVRRCPWHDRPIGTIGQSDHVSVVVRTSERRVSVVREDDTGMPWPVKIVR